jgi:hypothetical protein
LSEWGLMPHRGTDLQRCHGLRRDERRNMGVTIARSAATKPRATSGRKASVRNALVTSTEGIADERDPRRRPKLDADIDHHWHPDLPQVVAGGLGPPRPATPQRRADQDSRCAPAHPPRELPERCVYVQSDAVEVVPASAR